MKSVGITRRIDELGRIVIPKEIRNNLNIKKGELLEIFLTGSEEITLKKHSIINNNMSFINEYIICLSKFINSDVYIANTEKIIFSSNKIYNNEFLICDFDNMYKYKNETETLNITSNLKIEKPFKIIRLSPNGDLIGYIIISKISEEDLNKKNYIIDFTKDLISSFFETK